MSKSKMLSDNKIRLLKPKDKQYKVADGEGLYVFISPKGVKTFKARYRLDGKGGTISLGRYPALSLQDARVKNGEVKAMVVKGVKPFFGEVVKSEVLTFKGLCEKYLNHRRDELSEGYVKDVEGVLKNHYYPTMQNLVTGDIEALHIIKCVEYMNKKGLGEAIRKSGSLLDRIFKYGVTMQLMKYNPMRDIDMSILVKKKKVQNFAHITDEDELKRLLFDIEEYWGGLSVRVALQFMPYVFVRPFNIRMAEWVEFDFSNKLWTIPWQKMKNGHDHVVPLTDSMIKILEEVKGSGSKWVFASPQSAFKPLSENTLNVALKRMGYAGKMTTHGFRHTASTMLNEYIHVHGVGRDMIEVQMAHTIGGVEGVYNKATYLVKRRELMQWWSDFLDGLKST